MQIPKLLSERINADYQVASIVNGAIARFAPWVANSQIPFFPEYTDHSLTHVEDVLRTSIELATADALDRISNKDAATLVLAVCLHDCAMHLTEDGFFSLVRPDSAWRAVPQFDSIAWDVLWEEFLAESRRFDGRKLMALFGDTEPAGRPPENATDLSKRNRYLIGEFIRRNHARLAHEIALYGIPGIDGQPMGMIDRSSEVGTWLGDIAGVVARSHGIPLRTAVGYLKQKYHVRDFNGVHAAFLMVLVRVADFLQIQA
jgi:molecular chaperone HtpG